MGDFENRFLARNLTGACMNDIDAYRLVIPCSYSVLYKMICMGRPSCPDAAFCDK